MKVSDLTTECVCIDRTPNGIEPVYDVPSWPCEDDVRTEGNVAYGSVLGGMPVCSSARRMVHLEHSQEETSRDKGVFIY